MAAVLLPLCTQTMAQAPDRLPFDRVNPWVHDPVMAKEGDTYYIYGTGITAMSTKDFVTYSPQEPPFFKAPSWVWDYLPRFNNHTWAPDIIYYRGRWHLFYSCSHFARNLSLIGHASRSTLDPASQEQWKDEGMVTRSVPLRENWNAIDPAVAVDSRGRAYMVWGSFWDGVQMARLSRDLRTLKGRPRTIARRLPRKIEISAEPGENAIEAPFLFHHDGYWYLFVSWDYCCKGDRSTYSVSVGRSKNIEGPFMDRDGRDMLYGGGTPVVSKSSEYNAAGHCSVYRYDGVDFFLCHGYQREDGTARIVARKMEWDAEGWPVVDLERPSSPILEQAN